MPRRLFLAGIAIAIGLMAPLLLAEVVLRFLPVVTGLRTPAVNAAEPVKRFTPRRAFTYSRGWDFKGVNRGQTNNYGFVNDRDYDPSAATPLLAVVGDSYVEAVMVPFPETLQGRLAPCVDGRGRVYSFGVSGAALSQYLAEASFARSKFHPDGLVVVIVGNDFDEGLRRGGAAPGFHYFREDSGRLVLERVDYAPSLVRRLLRQSALVRYLTMNVPDGGNVLANVRRGLRGPTQDATRYVGNTSAAADPGRLASSQRVVEEFLALLPRYAGLEPRRIVLVVDGMRPDLYSPDGLRAAGGSYFDLMRRFLMGRAQGLGFEVIDMQPRFVARHARDGTVFEHPFDAHWSGRGHEEAARAVAASGVFQRVFPETSCVR
jgi:hypothetical protein